MDWTGIGTLATGLGTMGTAFVGWGTRKKASEIHQAVQTENGDTIGQRIDMIGDMTAAAEPHHHPKGWDGVDRRNSSGT